METSTVYITPSGYIEIPDIYMTYESNLAPKWIVTEGKIINTESISYIAKSEEENRINVYFKNGEGVSLHPKNMDITWKAFQETFLKGLNQSK